MFCRERELSGLPSLTDMYVSLMDVVRRCHVAAIRLSCSLRMYVVSYYNLCRDATRVRLLVRDSILGYLQLMLSSTCDNSLKMFLTENKEIKIQS